MSYFINDICEDIPTGAFCASTVTSDPKGWVICDGQSRTNSSIYNNLVTMGIGSRSGSTYTPPNLRDRTLRSITSSGTPSIKTNTGSDTASISTIPSHSHGVTNRSVSLGGHTHTINSHTHNVDHGHTAEWHTHLDDHNYSGNDSSPIQIYGPVVKGNDGVKSSTTYNHINGGPELVKYTWSNPTRNTALSTINTNSTTNTTFSYSATTGSSGSSSTFNIIHKSYVLNWIVKL